MSACRRLRLLLATVLLCLAGTATAGAQPTSIESFTATPTAIRRGESATLNWKVRGADIVAVLPAIQAFGSSSAIVKPTATTTYALNVSGHGGASIQFLTVSVTDAPSSGAGKSSSNAVAAMPTASVGNGSSDDKHPMGYALVFSDEFDGTSLDRRKWCTRYGYGGGMPLEYPDSQCTGPSGWEGTLDFLNAEQQRYVDHNTRGEVMHAVANGVLSLRATNTGKDSYARYEAAMIRSKLEFAPSAGSHYYIASRVRIPNVKGTWPAMWLVGGFGSDGKLTWPPEVDIFEGPLNGGDGRVNNLRISGQVHGQQTSTGDVDIAFASTDYNRSSTYYSPARNLRDTWLLLAADWSETGLCYYVDGVLVMCENYRWVLDGGARANPAQLILNLAVGGDWAGVNGIDDVFFPTSFEVDFVRIYRK